MVPLFALAVVYYIILPGFLFLLRDFLLRYSSSCWFSCLCLGVFVCCCLLVFPIEGMLLKHLVPQSEAEVHTCELFQ